MVNNLNKEDLPMIHAVMASEIELQKRYFLEGKVYILQIESTLKCDQFCKYCYADSKPYSTHGMSSSKIKGLIDSTAKLEVKMIDWLGGDPLLRNDWYELCIYAKKLGIINNIWTSGIPLANPNIARKVVEVTNGGFISTHLDTINPKLYDILHGGDDKILNQQNITLIEKGLKNIIKEGKNPGSIVNCITLTRPLADGDAKNMISYMQENFGIKTCLTLFNPVIHRNSNNSWEPTIRQIDDNFLHRDKINYPDDPSCGPMDVSKYYCGTVICVKADGWVTPCSVIRTREFGNINEESLESIINRTKKRLLHLDFRDPSKLPGNCGICANNINCFGCRSSAFYYNGDIMAADPKCNNFTPNRLKIKDE
ncbi:MAG: radical SAM protein [Candidatus Lokiarchaeota archaeon]|nr:radical SAM protein [Candidatus Lokiarchaeota archaeon]